MDDREEPKAIRWWAGKRVDNNRRSLCQLPPHVREGRRGGRRSRAYRLGQQLQEDSGRSRHRLSRLYGK